MLPFYKSPFAFHLNKDFIQAIIDRVETGIRIYNGGNHDKHTMVELQTHLHLLYGTLLSIKCCRLKSNQIISKDQIGQINELVPDILNVKPLNRAGND